MIHERAKSIVLGTLNLAAASLITGFIVYYVIGAEHDQRSEKRPCLERPCYAALDKRLAVSESSLKTLVEVKTDDRWRRADDDARSAMMMEYIRNSDRRLQIEIQVLRNSLKNQADETKKQ